MYILIGKQDYISVKKFKNKPQRAQRCNMTLNEISRKIIGSAFKVHKKSGPGFLETV